MSQLPASVGAEWTVGAGLKFPDSPQRAGGLLPSFADSTFCIAGIEPITVTITTPALSAGASQVVSQTQGFSDIAAVNLAKYDVGHFVVTNVSAKPPANILASHPQIQITSNQGNPPIGEFASGQSYTNLKLSVTCTVYATGAASAGTLTITGTAILLGGVQNV
jgi:hypothetical protein